MNVEGAGTVVFGHVFGEPAGENLANTIPAALIIDTEADAAI